MKVKKYAFEARNRPTIWRADELPLRCVGKKQLNLLRRRGKNLVGQRKKRWNRNPRKGKNGKLRHLEGS